MAQIPIPGFVPGKLSEISLVRTVEQAMKLSPGVTNATNERAAVPGNTFWRREQFLISRQSFGKNRRRT